MSSKLFSTSYKIPVPDPSQQLLQMRGSLVELQKKLQENPSGFAKTAQKTILSLTYQFETFRIYCPKGTRLRVAYDSTREEFSKIQKQLKRLSEDPLKDIPKLNPETTSCCVIL